MEVEIIGLPVDCGKEQTKVVDDNGKASFLLVLAPRLPLPAPGKAQFQSYPEVTCWMTKLGMEGRCRMTKRDRESISKVT